MTKYNQMNEFDYVIETMEAKGIEINKKTVMAAHELDEIAFMYDVSVDIAIDLFIKCDEDINVAIAIMTKFGEELPDPNNTTEEWYLTKILPNWKKLYAQVDADIAEEKRLEAEESLFPTIPTNSNDPNLPKVMMALTQYDDYEDFCERCEEFNCEVFMTEENYIKWFNESWGDGNHYQEVKEHNAKIKEENKMKTNTKNNTSVNAKVKENNKEEKKMTKATNMKAAMAEIRAELEKQNEGMSFAIGAQAPEKYARFSKLGMQFEEIKEIECITRKFKGNPDKDIAPKFIKTFKITLEDEDETAIMLDQRMFLYNEDGPVEINVYDAITNGKGTKGVYFTVKEKALEEKKANELEFEDLEMHELEEGERIWNPSKKELAALAKAYDVAEITFNENEVAELPKSKAKIALYVYEDCVRKENTVKNIDGKIKQFANFEYFYNVSFIAPEDQYDMKYGRRFTTSENAARRKEIAKLPGVVRYLESC